MPWAMNAYAHTFAPTRSAPPPMNSKAIGRGVATTISLLCALLCHGACRRMSQAAPAHMPATGVCTEAAVYLTCKGQKGQRGGCFSDSHDTQLLPPLAISSTTVVRGYCKIDMS